MNNETPISTDSPEFDEWAIIELFGHQKMAGHVTQASFGDFLRVDVVDQAGKTLFTRLLNPKAIYAINPVSEDVARAVAERFSQPPVQRWELPQLPAYDSSVEEPAESGHHDDYDDGNEDLPDRDWLDDNDDDEDEPYDDLSDDDDDRYEA